MPEDDFDWAPDAQWFVVDDEATAAAHCCAEMVVLAMHTKSKAASEGYLSAAQWFALASKTTRLGGEER